MSQENGARRNRALRKIRQCKKVPLGIKATIEALLDHMTPRTGYDAAWPSVATIASLIGVRPRTVRWYLRAIKKTRIFEFEYCKPEEARQFLLTKYGFEVSFDRCWYQAPTIYRVNTRHWLWGTSTKVTPKQAAELGKIVKGELAERNRSKSRTSERNYPTRNGKCLTIAASVRRNSYDIWAIRKGLKKFIRRAKAAKRRIFACQSNVANDMSKDVASDMTGNVVDDSQVLEKQKELDSSPSSCLSTGTPPTHRFLEAPQLAPVASFKGAATATPRGGLRTTTEVDKSPSVVLLRPHPNFLPKKQKPEGEDDSEFDLEKMTDEEIAAFCKDLAAETEMDDDPYDDLKDLSFRHPNLLDTSSKKHF